MAADAHSRSARVGRDERRRDQYAEALFATSGATLTILAGVAGASILTYRYKNQRSEAFVAYGQVARVGLNPEDVCGDAQFRRSEGDTRSALLNVLSACDKQHNSELAVAALTGAAIVGALVSGVLLHQVHGFKADAPTTARQWTLTPVASDTSVEALLTVPF